jgi:hypothetical protein
MRRYGSALAERCAASSVGGSARIVAALLAQRAVAQRSVGRPVQPPRAHAPLAPVLGERARERREPLLRPDVVMPPGVAAADVDAVRRERRALIGRKVIQSSARK